MDMTREYRLWCLNCGHELRPYLILEDLGETVPAELPHTHTHTLMVSHPPLTS